MNMLADNDLSFGGQPIQKWIEQLGHADPAERQRAAVALMQIAPAVCAMLPMLGPALRQLDADGRAEAVMTIGELGVRLQAVVPALHAAVKNTVLTDGDEAVRTSALSALTLLGPQSRSQVPALLEGLRDEAPVVRAGAAQALGLLGAEAKEAVPALTTALLRDRDFHVRVEAAVAVWRIDKRAGRVMPVLAEALEVDDEVLRWTAAECLGEMGADARPAIPALQSALQKPYQARLCRMGIQLALERIDSAAAQPSE